jgi:hypothetical protein
MILVCSVLLLFSTGFAKKRPAATVPEKAPFEGSIEIKQLEKVLQDLKAAMGDIPPKVDRLAIYQIRTDSRAFSPGLSKYIQARIETIFRDEGRRKVISPPELKTLTIEATDTSFSLTNTIPIMGDLWELGDKLRIDAYVDGTCGMSKDGDIMLNLKLIKHRSAEILWSGDYLAGPNRMDADIFDFKYSLSIPLRIYPIAMLSASGKDSVDAANAGNAGLDQFGIEFNLTESLTGAKRLYFQVGAGLSWSLLKTEGAQLRFKRLFTMQANVSLIAVIVPKTNPERGYWLGVYSGGKFMVPFGFSGMVPIMHMGYCAQLSKRFFVSAGGMYLAGNRALASTDLGSDIKDLNIDLKGFAYEFNVFNFTF